jgi:hypothetical protein
MQHEEGEIFIHGFGEETWRNKTTCKTKIWPIRDNHDDDKYNKTLKIGEKEVGWIKVAQGSNMLRDTVNTVMKATVPLSALNFLYS